MKSGLNKKMNLQNTKGLLILPGLIDVHTHLRQPGFEYKETIKTGTKAAAAGGFTTVCCMPNLKPVTDSVKHIKSLNNLISKNASVNVLPYSSITVGEQGKALVDMEAMAKHCFAFSDDGVGVQSKNVMIEAMLRAKKLNKVIVTHCEINGLKGSASEYKEVARNIKLAKQTGCQLHICHISTKESVALIRQAKHNKIKVTCEVTPHHLLLNKTMTHNDGSFKMNPPLRSKQDQEALIKGLVDGTIDLIATDHAPHSKEEKSRGLSHSLNGVVGLECSFALMFTYFVKTKKITLERLIELMSTNAQKIFGIKNNDNVSVFDVSKQWTIDANKFLSKGKSSPFNGWKCFGKTIYTIVNGKIVYRGTNE